MENTNATPTNPTPSTGPVHTAPQGTAPVSRPQGQRPMGRQHDRRPFRSNFRPHGPRPAGHGTAAPHAPRTGVTGAMGASSQMKRSMNRQKPRRRFNQGGPRPMSSENRMPTVAIPPIGENLRIIPLGGVEEIGKNMTAIEFGNDIIVIDAGFQFKDEATPGIDYILPNTKYLEERKGQIRGMFVTHGHLDHIGGIPYVIDRIGYPTIYTRQFGAVMIQKRQEEFPHLKPLDIKVITGNETITCGSIKVKTFPISHTIPDSMGLIIQTPFGDIVFIEDVRVDNIKGVPTEEEVLQYQQFAGKEALLLTMDSTSIEKPGFSLSESVVVENIEKYIKAVSGRLIIGTFASQVERIIAIIKISEKYGKKVVVEGRAMKTNVEIIKLLNLLEIKNVIPAEQMESYPPDRIVMLVTGSQGEEFAALMRIATKQHKHVQLRKTDTILLSSSIIPTNHNAVIKLKDNLYRTEAKVITYLDSDIHASGHGNRDELKWIHEHVKYRFFMPVHGYHYMLRQHAELAMALGVPRENIIVPDNGSVVEIYDGGKSIRILKEKAPSNLVLVDGFAVGDVQEVVIRDRVMLSQDGMFIVFALIDAQTGRLRKSPDIISRGFVYLRESQDLLRDARNIIKDTIEDTTRGMNPLNIEMIKANITDTVSRYLFQETAKKPVVIPVLLTV